jgi:hypothetical protein
LRSFVAYFSAYEELAYSRKIATVAGPLPS